MRFDLWTAAAFSTALAATSSTALEPGDPDDVTIEGSADGIELIRLLDLASAVTGEVYFYESRDVEKVTTEVWDRVVVPRNRFRSFVDELLFTDGFAQIERSIAGQRVHSIRRLPGHRSYMSLRTDAPIVPLEDFDPIADRRTLVTSFMVGRSSTLARRIACPTLCQFFSDSSIEAIRSIEDTPVILMSGQAQNVLRFAAMGKRIDEEFGPALLSEDFANLEARIRALEESVTRLERDRVRKQR